MYTVEDTSGLSRKEKKLVKALYSGWLPCAVMPSQRRQTMYIMTPGRRRTPGVGYGLKIQVSAYCRPATEMQVLGLQGCKALMLNHIFYLWMY